MDPSNSSSSSSSNKIRQIVRLQQLLKKWKKLAAASPSSSPHRLIRNNSATHHHLESNINSSSSASSAGTKSINKFLKKTLSFSDKDRSSSSADQGCNSTSDALVPKGCLAVSVGKEEKEEVKRFIIPMDYLAHQSFQNLLREAEEEFGFQQQGVLKIPCQVSVFENILKMMPHNSNTKRQQPPAPPAHDNVIHNLSCCSPENHQGIMPPQLCS